MKSLIILGLRGYQNWVSPLIHAVAGGGCRFEPSCSNYCLQAVERYGASRGAYLGARRLVRCHPWGGSGYDPVPAATDAGRILRTADSNRPQ